MLNFNTLRDEVQEWSDKNFGINQDKLHRPLLGIVEELGEFIEAYEAHKIHTSDPEPFENMKDAIADLVIFGADYASRKNWDYEALSKSSMVSSRPDARTEFLVEFYIRSISKGIGRMSHAQLKSEQGIRGPTMQHDFRAQEAMHSVFRGLTAICTMFGWDLREIVSEVWNVVKRRDFTKNRLDGQVHADSA